MPVRLVIDVKHCQQHVTTLEMNTTTEPTRGACISNDKEEKEPELSTTRLGAMYAGHLDVVLGIEHGVWAVLRLLQGVVGVTHGTAYPLPLIFSYVYIMEWKSELSIQSQLNLP